MVIESNDLVHGKEWKSHKYISKIFRKGHWVYLYTKNRLRGNKVTNKDSKLKYSPIIKTHNATLNFGSFGIPGIKGHTISAKWITEPVDMKLAMKTVSKYYGKPMNLEITGNIVRNTGKTTAYNPVYDNAKHSPAIISNRYKTRNDKTFKEKIAIRKREAKIARQLKAHHRRSRG